MAEAAILKYSRAIKTDNLSELKYDLDGYLTEFRLNGITYRHVRKNDFRSEDENLEMASGGYYNEAEFLKYLGKLVTLENITKNFKLKDTDLVSAGELDILSVPVLKISAPYRPFDTCCRLNFCSWTYVLNAPLTDANFKIIIPTNADVNASVINVGIQSKEFYDHKTDLFINISQPDAEHRAILIFKIAMYVNMINRDIFSLFVSGNNPQFEAYINSQNLEWSTFPIFNNPTIEDFQEYLINIKNFYESAYSNQLFIAQQPDEKKLYWLVCTLSVDSLKPISAFDKLKILALISKGSIAGETSALFYEINEEEFAIRVVKAVTSIQIEEFLEGLLVLSFNNVVNENTLFEILYDKINDTGFGNENLKAFMDAIYQKWLLSSYNPYSSDGQAVNDNLMNPGIYNLQKPIDINYESGSILLIFNDSNYDFTFSKSNIIVLKNAYQINPNGNAIPIKKNVGTYGIFQSITIKNTDSNTENTKFVTVNRAGNVRAVLPIFYLKYIDDKKATENLITAFEVTFDIGLTLTGVGNLGKLRHLKHLTTFGRLSLGLPVAPDAALIVYELAQGVAGVIEISSSLASILLSYGNTYQNTYCNMESQSYDQEKCEFYTNLDMILNLLQIFSGVLDFVTSRQLKNKATEMLNGPIPEDFSPDGLILLRKFAGDMDAIKLAFRERLFNLYGDYDSAIWRKVNNAVENGGLTAIKREEFLTDFANAPSEILDELNANGGDLIDSWNDINKFKKERTDIVFLKTFRKLRSNTTLLKHVHDGDAYLEPTKNLDGVFTGLTKAVVSGYHNPNKLVDPPPGQGQISWIDTFDYSNPNEPLLSYTQGKIRRNMSDFTDPATDEIWKVGNSNPPVHFSTKRRKNVFWPASYSTSRINEEMAYALSNMDLKKFVETPPDDKGLSTFIYSGFASDGHVIEILYYGGNHDVGTLISIYPAYF